MGRYWNRTKVKWGCNVPENFVELNSMRDRHIYIIISATTAKRDGSTRFSASVIFHELPPYSEAGIQDDIETLVLKTLFEECSR